MSSSYQNEKHVSLINIDENWFFEINSAKNKTRKNKMEKRNNIEIKHQKHKMRNIKSNQNDSFASPSFALSRSLSFFVYFSQKSDKTNLIEYLIFST